MKSFLFALVFLIAASCSAQTRQDTLRGSNGRGRDWWDVKKYELDFSLNEENGEIRGMSFITFTVKDATRDSLQIDLQEPLTIDSVFRKGAKLNFAKEGNVYWVTSMSRLVTVGDTDGVVAHYHGVIPVAKNPPWQGGLIKTRDQNGKPWLAVSCQGLGASSWWPCKDFQGDEPDGISYEETGFYAVDVNAIHNDTTLTMVLNGDGSWYKNNLYTIRPLKRTDTKVGVAETRLKNPINLYNLTFYLGDYTTFTDTFHGEGGVLPLTFHPLRYNESKARTHFAVTKDMLRCFEWWMGPYPFYEDGYKLVEAPYLGMEHQSAIAYGNGYQMGYLGKDRSGTGVGMLFDYIIIHESGHEWFGNNITAKDVADNWIHEGFTTYTETLYAEWIAGKEKAAAYNKGEWRNIENDRPIIGAYGINDDGSDDKYDKGAALLHMIRTMVGDDEGFRQMLRGLNKEFWHQTVTTKQVEDYISKKSGHDFSAFFNQYLRTTQIPTLEWYRKGKRIYYRFTNVVPGFSLPVAIDGVFGKKVVVSDQWSSHDVDHGVEWEDNFLIKIDKVSKRSGL